MVAVTVATVVNVANAQLIASSVESQDIGPETVLTEVMTIVVATVVPLAEMTTEDVTCQDHALLAVTADPPLDVTDLLAVTDPLAVPLPVVVLHHHAVTDLLTEVIAY